MGTMKRNENMPVRAVQQFQLGTVMNKEEQALETMARMKAAGYEGIELCGFMIKPMGVMVKLLTKAAGMPVGNGGKLDWPRMVGEAGLKVVSVHEHLGSIESDAESILKEAAQLRTDTVVVTGMYRFDYGSADEVKRLVERLNRAGERLAESNLRLLYHNHNCEFARFRGGVQEGGPVNAWQLLVAETDPAFVNFEFDSYWATDAGVDALAAMKSLGERLKLYHINDRGCRQEGPAMTPILKMDSMELGTGCMDLVSLVEQAKKAKVDAVILESHKNWIDGSPVRSFEVSAEFLKKYV